MGIRLTPPVGAPARGATSAPPDIAELNRGVPPSGGVKMSAVREVAAGGAEARPSMWSCWRPRHGVAGPELALELPGSWLVDLSRVRVNGRTTDGSRPAAWTTVAFKSVP